MTGRFAGQLTLEDGTPFVERLFIADRWWSRFRGLQFLRELPLETGLLLNPCRSVHTFWMRFPIHLLFVDQQGVIVEIQEHVRPWRVVVPTAPGIVAVLEVSISKPLPSPGTQLKRSNGEDQSSSLDADLLR